MNEYQFSFEKLEVWQLARRIAVNIYKRTSSFPAEEKYSLVSQIRRSILSVCSNLAEGTSRDTAKDKAHFTTMSFSSLMEFYNHLLICKDLGYMIENELDEYKKNIQLLSVKLPNLKKFQLSR